MKETGNYTRVTVLSLSLLFLALSLGTVLALADDWPQWMKDQQHTGKTNVAGQNLNQILEDIV